MARRKTFHRWTVRELSYMRTMYYAFTRKELAKQLGVTEAAVRDIMKKYGIKKPERLTHKRWTEKDFDLIRQRYRTTKAKVLAAVLGVNTYTIYEVVRRYNMRKSQLLY